MDNYDKAIEVLSDTIRQAVAYKLATASFDVTIQGIVKERLINNYYNIEVQGNIYKLKYSSDLNIGEYVNILMPKNNASNMFILQSHFDDGGVPTENVISINGKTGVVLLEISDIPDLSEILDSKLNVGNILEGNNIELVKSGNDITINTKPVTYEYNQVEPSNQWVITHNLNKYPSVTILDTSNTQIFANVSYIDKTQLIIKFDSIVSGIAILN